MPDHLHLLPEGNRPIPLTSLSFVQRFKQVTGFHFKTTSGDRPWQQSFFDRVLRENEEPSAVAAEYVF